MARPRELRLLDALLAINSKHTELCASALDKGVIRARVDQLADAARSRLQAGTSDSESGEHPKAAVEALNAVVLGPSGLRSSQDLRDPCNLLLSGVLARDQGYCVGIAAVYLAVAEQLDLPIFAVSTPTHVFLRYDDGQTRFNIETSGSAFSDDQYATRNRIAPSSLRKGVFLDNLSRERLLAQVHNNLGVIYSERREFDKAMAEYDTARRLDCRFPSPWYNHGNDLREQGRLKEAVRAYTKALHLHPTDTWALNNRGRTWLDLLEPSRAREDFEAALAIDPEFLPARRNLAALDATKTTP